jgi:iron complex outermembrane receptor protein
MRSCDFAAITAVTKVASACAIFSGCLAVLPATAQTSLPTIDVQRAPRSAGATVSQQSAGTAEPATAPAPTEESAYGPVQGYLANRSATGTKTDTPISEIPQSITVVTADEIRDQGAKTIQESLRYVPGAFADAYGPDSRGDYPRVRGSDPNIYLDGTQAINSWLFNEWRPDPLYAVAR